MQRRAGRPGAGPQDFVGVHRFDERGVERTEAKKSTSEQALAGTSNSGYTLARLRFEIILAPEAVRVFKSVSARIRTELRFALETHLRHEPRKLSKSRIKRLRGLRQPQYRLRVEDIRIFYDVVDDEVQVLAIVTKVEAQAWLRKRGIPE